MATGRLKALKEKVVQWFRTYSVYISIFILTILFFVVLLSGWMIFNIKSGQLGVRWSRFGGGTILDRVYDEGFRMIVPWDEMYVYNIRVQELHDEIYVLSSNGLPMKVSYSCRYYPDPAQLPKLHQRYGPEYAELLVRPEVVSAIRIVIGNYKPEQIYSRDEQALLDEVFATLQANITNNYVIVNNVLIKELRLPPELEKSINNKLVQEQESESYAFRLKTEESERQRKEIEAKGIKAFQTESGISILKWKGIEATLELAKSPNAKTIIVGTSSSGLPVMLSNP
jgi:regulator of protease activity HflC (stomatin/prohibitin superfamily)